MGTNLDYDYDAVISYCASSQCTEGFTALDDDLNALATDLYNLEDVFHCKSGTDNCIDIIYDHFSKILGSTDGVDCNSGSGLGKILTYGAAVVNTCYTEALIDKGVLEEGYEYCIQSGDTLNAISARTGVSVEDLCKANGITNPNLIIAGQTLTIPGASGTSNNDLANVSLDEEDLGNVGITFGDDAFTDEDTDTGVMATDGASSVDTISIETTETTTSTDISSNTTGSSLQFGEDGLLVKQQSQAGQDVINKLFYEIPSHANGTHSEKLDSMIDNLSNEECVWVLSRIENEAFGQTGAGYYKATPESHQNFVEEQVNGRYGGDIHNLLKSWGTYTYSGY